MLIKISVLTCYFLVVLGIGLLTRLRWKSSSEAYFLADRRLGPVILLATMAATNFSAFTVYGTSGAGYRDGWSFFPIMGFGTGFMAMDFWAWGTREPVFLGVPLWVCYFVLLSALQTGAMACMIRREFSQSHHATSAV